MSISCHTLSRVFGHIPMTAAYNHFIYTIFYNATLRNYFTHLHTRGRGGPPALPAQRACNSESGTCTSMASSGSPGSSWVEHKVERLESDRGSLKVRGCSSSIMDAHSHDHHRGLASPSSHVLSLGGTLRFDSPHPSTSSCSSFSPSSCICSPPPLRRSCQSRPGGGGS